MTVVAIDFGTSNTVVSLLEPDTQQAKTLRLDRISRLFRLQTKAGERLEIPVIPTLAYVRAPEELVLGQQVRSQRLGFSEPQRLFKAFKRDLAADFQPPPRQLDGVTYDARSISEQFLQAIWQELTEKYVRPSQVIFTVPVGAFERYLDWFRHLAQALGIEQFRLVDESTAAALGYGVKHPGSLVLVVDWGGGTLDLSLVRTATAADEQNSLQAQVIAKFDAYIGGEDIDGWIVEDYLRDRGSSRETVGTVGWQNLLELAERLKIRLSHKESAQESWLDEETFTSYDIRLTQEKLEEILEDRQFLQQLREGLDEVLTTATSKGIQKGEIERVLLVGGSCLIPAVRQLIGSYFGKPKVKFGKPFAAVSHGALALSQIDRVEDNLRHSYAIRLWEPHSRTYSYFTLFEKGSSYPCKREEPLMLQVATEGQKEIRLDIGELAEVAQGEVTFDGAGRMTSRSLNHCEAYHSLDRDRDRACLAHLDPPGKAGIDRIAVTFEVNAQRTLQVTVKDLLLGKILLRDRAIAELK
ncbi:Hsp70 family protein [Lusitaniella coriacea LEGE 07157]|uniref:Hsp70 family protein n=1 Tax=Lusitaniella coriacea LEGE 07157 TaxID=945747 RepID=A0A8J7DWU1_9CYAN|nr:Hsp70 family protein [Lusitaniella coriacea]MBE9115721.1 Hsp70 family protein [Lusitaniella coriacea LEGE 07157]